jgi:5-methylcytosine-specific restriction enzyme subunit McrC
MLRAVGSFDIKTSSSSNLKIKPNTILDLYFELFIKEVEYLYHSGLVKKYRKTEGNTTALKGNLMFGKHMQQNLTHQERFYVSHTTYDTAHLLHFILYKAIKLLKQINTNTDLHSRIGALMLNFPEMSDIKVTEITFNNIVYNRKTTHYQKAIEIARLILLQYHPDVKTGRNHVLALMFDMNKLWEQFVYVSLRRNNEFTVTAQTSKYFWKPEIGSRSKIIPDIWIKKGEESFILDTKWKNLNGYNPSPEDLRQMFVYHEYYQAQKVALVYPGIISNSKYGNYLNPINSEKLNKECSIISIAVPEIDKNISIRKWQNIIAEQINNFINFNKTTDESNCN